MNGGLEPNWSSDGRRLFYLSGEAGSMETFWSVEIRTEPAFWYGRPVPLFTLKEKLGPGIRNVDFSTASNKFAALMPPPDRAGADLVRVVLNWFTELRTRVPTR
jgi:hypothetical protein